MRIKNLDKRTLTVYQSCDSIYQFSECVAAERRYIYRKGRNRMYEDEWNRFMRTGQVNDYLAYKGHQGIENASDRSGEIHECGDTGFRQFHGNRDKIGADWRI